MQEAMQQWKDGHVSFTGRLDPFTAALSERFVIGSAGAIGTESD